MSCALVMPCFCITVNSFVMPTSQSRKMYVCNCPTDIMNTASGKWRRNSGVHLGGHNDFHELRLGNALLLHHREFIRDADFPVQEDVRVQLPDRHHEHRLREVAAELR